MSRSHSVIFPLLCGTPAFYPLQKKKKGCVDKYMKLWEKGAEMKRATRPQVRKYGPRIKGLVQAAQILGCSRSHLRLVILGRRKSPTLLKKFQQVKLLMIEPQSIPAPEFQANAKTLNAISGLTRQFDAVASLMELTRSRTRKLLEDIGEVKARFGEVEKRFAETVEAHEIEDLKAENARLRAQLAGQSIPRRTWEQPIVKDQ
jgi:hypothetical protein